MSISVIVVDDDNDSLEVLSEYLSLKELNVLAKAKNGKEAVEIYKKFMPDVVLLDVLMPGYDGFYAIEKIKEFNPDAKVIFVTAAIIGPTQRKLFTYDVDGIIFKPFDIENLIKWKIVEGGMIPKIENCVDAVENGVRGVVILDGRKPHSILHEIFSDTGSGTLIRK